MNADIILSSSFPHGTPEGFRQGCHGAHCPAPIACRDVHRRYAGDYSFRKMIDAGTDLNVILIRDQEAARAAVLADRVARRAANRRTNPAPARTGGRVRRPYKINGEPSTPLQYEIVKWHGQGLSDSQIAEKVGKSRDQVRASRRWLSLPPNRALTAIDHIRRLHGEGLTDQQMADRLNKNVGWVGTLRRRAGLPLNKHPRWNIDPDQFRALHAQGFTDRQLGEHFGVDPRTASKRRRRLGLPVNPAPPRAGLSRRKTHK